MSTTGIPKGVAQAHQDRSSARRLQRWSRRQVAGSPPAAITFRLVSGEIRRRADISIIVEQQPWSIPMRSLDD
jgi:hypothetical protein